MNALGRGEVKSTRASSLSDLAGRNYVHSWNDAMILWP